MERISTWVTPGRESRFCRSVSIAIGRGSRAETETAATPIPPAAEPLALPPGARVLLLAGLDQPDPFIGRSDAILLLLYHPRLA